MSGEIRPWIGYITMVDVEHEDEITRVSTGLGNDPASEFLERAVGIPKEIDVKQGIAAGVVVATGEGVPELEPGAKVYYAERSAIIIGQHKVIHSNYVVAWEAA